MSSSLDLLRQKLAAAPKHAGLVDHILEDLIGGGRRNPRTGHVQVNPYEWETKMSADTYLERAKVAGAVQALGEAGFSVKEAASALNMTEAELAEVLR